MSEKHTDLQSALYAREIKSITSRVAKHVEAIREIFREYFPEEGIGIDVSGERSEDLAALKTWLSNTPTFSTAYYAGYSAFLNSPDVANMPKVLKEAIAAKAINDFMEKVDSIYEVRAMADYALEGGSE